MKVLIPAVNAHYSHTCLAAYILKTQLTEAGIPCSVQESTINDRTRDTVTAILAAAPTHVLFPVYIWNSEKVRAVAGDVRELLPDAFLAAGGPEALSPEFSGSVAFDALIDGECEGSITGFLLQHPSRPFPGGGPRLVNFGRADFAETPFPYTREELQGFSTKIAYYESIRGCPYSCGYCASGSRQASSCRRKALDTVLKDLDRFLEHPPRMVKFVDRTFNLYNDHARGIWTYLAGLPDSAPPLTFHFELHPGRITPDDIELLRELPPRRVQVEVGIQSVTGEVLTACRRGGQSDWPGIRENLLKLNRLSNVRTHLDQIVGLPFSDPVEAARSFEEILSTGPRYFQLGFLKVLHHTEFYDRKGDFGFIHSMSPPYEVYRTKWMDPSDLALFHRIEWAVDALYNSGNFRRVMTLVLEKGAYIFFREFTGVHLKDADKDVPPKKWEALSVSVMNTCDALGYGKEALDLLRLDWCAVCPSALYPGQLKPCADGEMEQERLKVWEQLKEEGFSRVPGGFSMRIYNKSILYLAATSQGIAAAGGRKVLFIPAEKDPAQEKLSLVIDPP
ncbi:MAG: DUF4080 domain-containing protein [Spirochaetales bacterium]|nr:DUF4080 domain-containing protein [Spirochaetales bacterium]